VKYSSNNKMVLDAQNSTIMSLKHNIFCFNHTSQMSGILLFQNRIIYISLFARMIYQPKEVCLLASKSQKFYLTWIIVIAVVAVLSMMFVANQTRLSGQFKSELKEAGAEGDMRGLAIGGTTAQRPYEECKDLQKRYKTEIRTDEDVRKGFKEFCDNPTYDKVCISICDPSDFRPANCIQGKSVCDSTGTKREVCMQMGEKLGFKPVEDCTSQRKICKEARCVLRGGMEQSVAYEEARAALPTCIAGDGRCPAGCKAQGIDTDCQFVEEEGQVRNTRDLRRERMEGYYS